MCKWSAEQCRGGGPPSIFMVFDGLVAKSNPTLANTGSSVHGMLQARILEWGAISFFPLIFTKKLLGRALTAQSLPLPHPGRKCGKELEIASRNWLLPQLDWQLFKLALSLRRSSEDLGKSPF